MLEIVNEHLIAPSLRERFLVGSTDMKFPILKIEDDDVAEVALRIAMLQLKHGDAVGWNLLKTDVEVFPKTTAAHAAEVIRWGRPNSRTRCVTAAVTLDRALAGA